MRRVDVLPVASECGLVLFACSTGVGIYRLSQMGASKPLAYLLVSGIPATAALAFLVVTFVFPSFFVGGKLRFPVNLTAPLAFSAMMMAALMLWSTNENSLKSMPESMAAIRVWANLALILRALTLQIVVLTAIVAVRGNNQQK